jgi:hypothetical protein
VHHAVDAAIEADKQPELRDVADRALDLRPLRVRGEEDFPRVVLRLLEPQRDAPLLGIDLEDLHVDLLAGGDDLAGMDVLLCPAHLGDVDQTFHPGLELHERAVVGDVGHRSLEAGADRIFGLDAGPRVGLQLLHAEADALRLRVDAHDLYLDGIADVDDLARMIDAAPGHVGDVQQAVDAAQVDEGAVVGDVLDHAIDHLALGQLGDDLGALLGACRLQDLAARDDDVAAAPVHLQDLEGLRRVHERADVAHGPHVHLAARQERHGAVEVDCEAALHLVEDDAFDLLLGVELLLEPGPALLTAGLVARQHRLTERVLDALEVDLDGIADLQLLRLAGDRELAQGNAALHLETHVDHRQVLLDGGYLALHDAALEGIVLGERLTQQRGEILAGGVEFL